MKPSRRKSLGAKRKPRRRSPYSLCAQAYFFDRRRRLLPRIELRLYRSSRSLVRLGTTSRAKHKPNARSTREEIGKDLLLLPRMGRRTVSRSCSARSFPRSHCRFSYLLASDDLPALAKFATPGSSDGKRSFVQIGSLSDTTLSCSDILDHQEIIVGCCHSQAARIRTR